MSYIYIFFFYWFSGLIPYSTPVAHQLHGGMKGPCHQHCAAVAAERAGAWVQAPRDSLHGCGEDMGFSHRKMRRIYH